MTREPNQHRPSSRTDDIPLLVHQPDSGRVLLVPPEGILRDDHRVTIEVPGAAYDITASVIALAHDRLPDASRVVGRLDPRPAVLIDSETTADPETMARLRELGSRIPSILDDPERFAITMQDFVSEALTVWAAASATRMAQGYLVDRGNEPLLPQLDLRNAEGMRVVATIGGRQWDLSDQVDELLRAVQSDDLEPRTMSGLLDRGTYEISTEVTRDATVSWMGGPRSPSTTSRATARPTPPRTWSNLTIPVDHTDAVHALQALGSVPLPMLISQQTTDLVEAAHPIRTIPIIEVVAPSGRTSEGRGIADAIGDALAAHGGEPIGRLDVTHGHPFFRSGTSATGDGTILDEGCAEFRLHPNHTLVRIAFVDPLEWRSLQAGAVPREIAGRVVTTVAPGALEQLRQPEQPTASGRLRGWRPRAQRRTSTPGVGAGRDASARGGDVSSDDEGKRQTSRRPRPQQPKGLGFD